MGGGGRGRGRSERFDRKARKVRKGNPMFKALAQKNSEMRFGRLGSKSFSDLMKVGNSLRFLPACAWSHADRRSWR